MNVTLLYLVSRKEKLATHPKLWITPNRQVFRKEYWNGVKNSKLQLKKKDESNVQMLKVTN